MSDQTAARTPRPRPKRGEGQWALGHREPLNKNEQSKKDDNPLNVRARIINIYSKRGFDSIDPADLRGRFRWMGLYTQRAPGFDGGKTATRAGGGARRPLLHAARALRRPPARTRRRPRPRHHRPGLRPRHRRRHRPRQHPVPLDPRRGRPGDLGPPRRGRPELAGGVRRLPAPVPRLAGRRRRRRRDHRRQLRAGGDLPPLHRRPGVLEPAAQVQDRADRPPQPRRLPRDQRRLLRRHRAPRARPRLRRVGRRRPVDQPDARRQARRLDPARGRAGRLGGRGLGLPRLRLPPPALARPPEVPGQPTGAWRSSARSSRPSTSRSRSSRTPRRPPPSATATTSACTSRRTASATSGSPPPPAGSPAPRWCSSPTCSRSSASRASASRRTRRSC